MRFSTGWTRPRSRRSSASDADRVLERIAASRGELVDILRRLVAFETVSPPARNTGPLQDWISGFVADLGLEVDRWELYPGDANVVATLPGTDREAHRSLILNGHVDVTEPGPVDQWAYSPFALTEGADGRLYGRGVADMKGALAATLLVVRALVAEQAVPRGDLQLQFVIGEEAGEAGTASALERGHRADFAIVTDGSALRLQGQGGVITGWITVESPETFHDGMRARMIHAGGGVHGASAIEKMMVVVAALQELERSWAVRKSFPGFAPGANTINPAVIEGGRHAAFVADRCALWITAHFYPDERYQDVAREIEDHVLRAAAADPWLHDHPPRFRWGGRSMIEERGEIFPALALDPDHAGVRGLVAAYTDEAGAAPTLDMSPSVTDVGWFGEYGIPAVLFGPGELEQAHTVDESADPADLVLFARILGRFVLDWCDTRR